MKKSEAKWISAILILLTFFMTADWYDIKIEIGEVFPIAGLLSVALWLNDLSHNKNKKSKTKSDETT